MSEVQALVECPVIVGTAGHVDHGKSALIEALTGKNPDLEQMLAAVGEDAIEGAITGRALYEGNFTLAQALTAARGEE